MENGAVAMIDALGFKGIWRREEVVGRPEQVLEKLGRLKDAALERIQDGEKFRQGLSEKTQVGIPTIAFLSDTVFFGVPLTGKDGPDRIFQQGFALHSLIAHTSRLLESASVEAPTLAYRGCITFGEYTSRDPFILGPAIDEAAGMMDEADGAFVWLSPRAKQIWETFVNAVLPVLGPVSTTDAAAVWQGREANIGLLRYDVPMKNGSKFETYAVSPFARAFDSNRRTQIVDYLMKSFSDPNLSVQIKKQNTAAFLAAARAHKEAHLGSSVSL